MGPDYTKSIAETYIEFARQEIQHRGELGILEFAEQHQFKTEDMPGLGKMPSWVPCWNMKIISEHITFDWPLLKPSSSFEGALTRNIRGTTLMVTGIVFDSIPIRSDVLKPQIQAVDVVDLWNTIRNLDLARAYHAVEPRFSVLWECLHAGRRPYDMEFDAWSREKEVFDNFLLKIAEENLSIETLAGREDLLKTHPMMSWYSGSGRLISTTRGLLGIAPGGVMDGDVCAIIFGCPLPFILRRETGRSENKVPQYTIIGRAWVAELQGGGTFVPLTGSEDSKDWVDWGLKEHDIHIV